MINPSLYTHFKAQGISISEAERQYKLLSNGAQYCILVNPATLLDGILPLSVEEAESLAKDYSNAKEGIRTLKFVPASGAATRMFKDLVEFNSTGKASVKIEELKENIHRFAFFDLIPPQLSETEAVQYLISTLHFDTTPKGLIPFHTSRNGNKTAFEEHWLEVILYAASEQEASIHFTVSVQHQAAFEQLADTHLKAFESANNTQVSISYSNQLALTDTLCINADKNIMLTEKGAPLFRPGGHGALIQNLNNLEANLVFIKNIDNVVNERHIATTVLYKKALAGKLLQVKEQVFNALNTIDTKSADLTQLEKLGSQLFIKQPEEYIDWERNIKLEFWKSKLNRPMRVCGMVKNEGEPGGGPFWVETQQGISLQIIESAQIDINNSAQLSILEESTHFNPVDLVCYLTNYQGNKFNLEKYIDASTAFITTKTVNGKEVRVLEHPGLWNGAMADWITIFMEVPIETFNPVKTVNDLLKSAHLS